MTGQFRVKKVFYGLSEPSVGLAAEYVADGPNTVQILEVKKGDDGKPMLRHPGTFTIDGDEIRNYPLKQYSGVPLQYFVPLTALSRKEK